MKRLPLFVISLFVPITLLAIGTVHQQRFTFVDKRKDPTVKLEADRGMVVPEESFILEGNVILDNLTSKVRMVCQSATGKLVKSNKKQDLDAVRMKGSFKLTQNGAKGNDVTATADQAEYDLIDTSKASIKLNGNVRMNLLNATELKKDFTTTARSGVTVIDRNEKDKDKQVISANLEGPITFAGNQLVLDSETKKTTVKDIKGKADSLVFVRKGESGRPEVKLLGNIEFLETTDNEETGFVTGAQIAIMELNDKNEVVKMRFSSDGKAQIKTIVKKSGGKR